MGPGLGKGANVHVKSEKRIEHRVLELKSIERYQAPRRRKNRPVIVFRREWDAKKSSALVLAASAAVGAGGLSNVD